jgi:CheY-like chemotaxis protein
MKKYKSVFLVDDSEMDRFIGKKILENCQITENVIIGKNGIDGLNRLAEYYYDYRSLPELMLIDLQMPMMGGIELIQQLTMYSGYSESDCKIIAITADMENQENVESLKSLGVKDILSKPLNKEELISIL